MRTPLEQFIDTALAAAVASGSRGQMVYLDIYPQQAAIAAMHAGSEPLLEKTEVVSAAGVSTLYELWAQRIARRFIDHTRFDPLYNAASRQALFEALPGWLEQLAARPDVDAALAFGGERHTVRLAGEDLANAAAPVYERILQRLRRLRRAGQPTAIEVSRRAAVFPGLLDRLAALRDVSIVGRSRSIGGGQNADRHAGQDADEGARPTHVLYRGQAHALGEQPLVVGLAGPLRDGHSPRCLQIAGASAGISPRHCSLLRMPRGAAVVVDHSHYGTWLNEEAVFERAPLRAGDRLRVGTPGITLELIAIG